MSAGLPVNGGSEQKRTETNPEYARYLQSPRWRALTRAVRIRAKEKCEICWRWDGEECAKSAQAAPLLAAGGNEGVWQGARCPLPNGG
jgi:hypothetical protein